LAKSYDPGERLKLSKKKRHLWNNTFKHLTHYLKNTNFTKATCKFWDKRKNIKDPTSTVGLKARNENMVKVIKKNYPNFRRIFIIAGLYHLPTGEFSHWTETTLEQKKPSLSYFFEMVNKNSSFNTTKNIFDFTKSLDRTEVIYIHHKRLVKPNLLPF